MLGEVVDALQVMIRQARILRLLPVGSVERRQGCIIEMILPVIYCDFQTLFKRNRYRESANIGYLQFAKLFPSHLPDCSVLSSGTR